MPIKILLLSDPNSSHTIKWARALSQKGFDIFIFGLSTYNEEIYKDYNKVKVYTLGLQKKKFKGSDLFKLIYLKGLIKLKQILKNFRPDILHAHFASSYGLLGALSGFHPYILSVWGSDVYTFPTKSPLHKRVLKYNLIKADKILSTGHIMAQEIHKYINKDIEVTPFGIDIEVFKPQNVESYFTEDDIVIGTVKNLEKEYGIDILIRAFKIVKNTHPNLPFKLLIVGDGSLKKQLQDLVKNLKLEDDTVFTGFIPHDEVQKYHNMMSISVFVSNRESFGVSVIEASACEKPVIVSNVGGLTEVVEDGVTGFVVHARNNQKTAEAIEKLIINKALRIKMGKAGRKRVKELYNWKNNLQYMIDIYESIRK